MKRSTCRNGLGVFKEHQETVTVVTKRVKGRVGSKGRGEAGWAGGSEVKGLVGLSG